MKLFCDLAEIAENRDIISSRCETGKWCSMEYRTKLGEGKLLVAAEDIHPDSVTLQLNLEGWYKIYISLFHMRSENYCFVKLSGDEEYTPVRKSKKGNPNTWCATEYMEEVYWKCADLTGQKLILAKPMPHFYACSGLAWIRCEEMTEEEMIQYQAAQHKKNKCVQMHFDIDSFFEDRTDDKTEHFAKMNMLKNTNVDFCSIEYFGTYDPGTEENFIPLHHDHLANTSGKYSYQEIFSAYLDIAHRNDIKLFAAERMSMANFYAPYSRPDWRNQFVTEHKEYYCKNRDGSTLNICSYAYEAVQDYVIKNMLSMIHMGYDGITMIFHRGAHIAFEQPVIERFAERYPEVDPRQLPFADERLHGIWCEFMTEFMRRARKAFDQVADRHIEINVITDYGLESAKNLGLDVAAWAREGLVDCVSQADMETYEDLTDCMSDGDDRLIDLEKYKKRLEDFQIIKRNFATNVEKVCQHMQEYLQLEALYRVKVYHVLPWVHQTDPEQYMEKVEQMQKCGAKRFLAWNTNHMMWNLPEYHIVSEIGNQKAANVTWRQFYRTLSLEGSDISQFNPNWRG